MADRVAEAEARLVVRMAQARAQVARERARLAYVPFGLVAFGMLGVFLMESWGPFKADFSVAPLMLAVSMARACGLHASRLAAALTAPLLLYAMRGSWDGDSDDIIWLVVHLGGLIALSVDASSLSGLRALTRRSSGPRRPSPRTRHMRTRWRPIALPDSAFPRP
jgi:hypothetical protein